MTQLRGLYAQTFFTFRTALIYTLKLSSSSSLTTILKEFSTTTHATCQNFSLKNNIHVVYFIFQYLYRASFIILYNDQQMYNYFKNYHIPTCFDTTVSFSGNSKLVPCQVIGLGQMQLSVIQFKTISHRFYVVVDLIIQNNKINTKIAK